MPEPQNPRSSGHFVSWPEIFSQHESNLNRHLQICLMVKQHVVQESPSARVLSSMVDRTQELLRLLDDLRIEFMPQCTATRILSSKSLNRVEEQRTLNKDAAFVCHDPSNSQSATLNGSTRHSHDGSCAAAGTPVPPFVFDKGPIRCSVPQHLGGRNKRTSDYEGGTGNNDEATVALPSRKRQKFCSPENGKAVDGDDASASTSNRFVETEDISAEVEARLKAKEENRRRRAEKREKKRKRSSSGSASGASGPDRSSQQRTKRSRVHYGADGEELSSTCPTDVYVPRHEKRKTHRRCP
ncbi:hypothetical protein I7I48_01329 [Histoplasma ohiense]|nr:hypothetical protein I7I48_01329 [Histoplasma ohiense (nom. inval.)]